MQGGIGAKAVLKKVRQNSSSKTAMDHVPMNTEPGEKERHTATNRNFCLLMWIRAILRDNRTSEDKTLDDTRSVQDIGPIRGQV
jgi:hypothetical protein